MIAAKISRCFHCLNCQSEPMSIVCAAFFLITNLLAVLEKTSERRIRLETREDAILAFAPRFLDDFA